jgi:hypothetical protein
VPRGHLLNRLKGSIVTQKQALFFFLNFEKQRGQTDSSCILHQNDTGCLALVSVRN